MEPCTANAFLKIDGVVGDSREDRHHEWISLLSIAHGLSLRPADPNNVDHGFGESRHEDFVVTKNIDKASPRLYELCCSGEQIREAVADVCGVHPLAFCFTVRMSHVVICDISLRGSSPANAQIFTADAPIFTETLRFSYAAIEWIHRALDADGRVLGNVLAGWNLRTGTKR